jgi:hypothetical protein
MAEERDDRDSTTASAARDETICYWLVILWDSGLTPTRDIRRQLLSLLRIRDSFERQDRLSSFPSLLVLAPDARRAHVWQAQALRLASERWLTHPILGSALALDDAVHRGANIAGDDSISSLSFPPAIVDSMNPWQAAGRSFAQPGMQTLGSLLQSFAG